MGEKTSVYIQVICKAKIKTSGPINNHNKSLINILKIYI